MAVGVPVEFILGTNKCVSSTGATFAVGRYIMSKTIFWKTMIYAVIAALIGSAIGARLSIFMSKNLMFLALLVVIPTIFYLQARQRNLDSEMPALPQTSQILRVMPHRAGDGGYDGLFGPWHRDLHLLAFMAFCTCQPGRPAPMPGSSTMHPTSRHSFIFSSMADLLADCLGRGRGIDLRQLARQRVGAQQCG